MNIYNCNCGNYYRVVKGNEKLEDIQQTTCKCKGCLSCQENSSNATCGCQKTPCITYLDTTDNKMDNTKE